MAEQISVKVTADSSGLGSGLAQASRAVEGFKDHAEGQFASLGKSFIGLFAVGAITNAIQSLLDEFGRIQDLSDRLGENATSLQRIGEAAKLSGTDLETVISATQKASNNAFKAIEGNTELAQSFETLGTSAEAFVNLSTEDKLLTLAKGFENGGANAELLRASMEILGKSGAELAPLLGQGAESLRGLFQSASVASDESVRQLAQAGDKIDKTFSTLKAAGVTALAFIIDKVQVLWAALNTIGVFLSELPNGFKAAMEAADDFSKDFFEKRDAENAPKQPGKQVDVEAIKERAEVAKKAGDDEKRAAEELAKAVAENRRKEQEAFMRSMSLLEMRLELERQLRELQNQAPANALDAEKNKGKALDIQKDLEAVSREISRETERAEKEASDKARREQQERLKDAIKGKRDELHAAEDSVRDISRNRGELTVDNLRAIGGGIAGANYNAEAAKTDLQRQQLDCAKQQVEKLSRVIATLEAAQKQTSPSYDSGFVDS